MGVLDLTDRLGFKASLDLDTGVIHFEDLKPKLVLERVLRDMQPVLAKQPEENYNPLVHRIYRMIGDTEEIIGSGLKFDITVILPQQFGNEFPKTTGHYHLPLQNGTATPDFYQIVYGKGLIILQTEEPSVKAFKVDTKEMQYVLIPPNMGHLTVNTGKEPLVFANICIRAEHLNYEPYMQRKGGAFYLFEQDNEPVFSPNPNYRDQSLETLKPNTISPLGNLTNLPFYTLLKGQIARLEFLTQPQNYCGLFDECLTN